MKKIKIILVAMIAVSCANAAKKSEKDVPAVVQASLQKLYADAKDVTWENEDGNYEAEFKINNAKHSVLLDSIGDFLEVEEAINNNALPKNAKEYIATYYAGKAIEEAAKITNNKNVVTYEAEINHKDLIFDNNGNFIK